MSTGKTYAYPEETYGIHLLKVGAILLQIIAHSYLWSIQQGLIVLGNIGTVLNDITYCSLSLAYIIPMTAGAVLRMVSQVDTANDRVVNVDWSATLATSAGLALVESIKQMSVYHGSGFFSWNVLHLIAVTFPMLLWVARYSIKLVWSFGISIMLVTPAVIRPLRGDEHTVPLDFLPLWLSPKAVVLATVAAFIALTIIRRTLRSNTFAPQHKKRFTLVVGCIGALVIALLLRINGSPVDRAELATLPLGALVGTESGLHIWAFFPWAGSIFLGFAVYDLVIRRKAAPWLLAAMVAVGLILLKIFFELYIYDVTASLSATAGFSGVHFNRTPEKMLMVVGFFLLATPLVIVLSRRGAERPYIVQLSRYVLWLYIYQTTILVAVPGIVQHHLGNVLSNIQCVGVAAVISFATAVSLPALIKRLPLNLRLQLKKAA